MLGSLLARKKTYKIYNIHLDFLIRGKIFAALIQSEQL